MKKLSLLFVFAGTMFAGPVLTLDPVGGAVYGHPGDTVGWGFTFSSDDTNWISVIGTVVLFETNPSLGVYLDFIGTEGGPTSGMLAPAAPEWTQTFDPNFGQGLGEYFIDPAAPTDRPNSGTFRVLYEVFSGDPNTCGGCLVDSQFIDAPFTVTATAPEPAPGLLIAFGCLLAGIWVRRPS